MGGGQNGLDAAPKIGEAIADVGTGGAASAIFGGERILGQDVHAVAQYYYEAYKKRIILEPGQYGPSSLQKIMDLHKSGTWFDGNPLSDRQRLILDYMSAFVGSQRIDAQNFEREISGLNAAGQSLPVTGTIGAGAGIATAVGILALASNPVGWVVAGAGALTALVVTGGGMLIAAQPARDSVQHQYEKGRAAEVDLGSFNAAMKAVMNGQIMLENQSGESAPFDITPREMLDFKIGLLPYQIYDQARSGPEGKQWVEQNLPSSLGDLAQTVLSTYGINLGEDGLAILVKETDTKKALKELRSLVNQPGLQITEDEVRILQLHYMWQELKKQGKEPVFSVDVLLGMENMDTNQLYKALFDQVRVQHEESKGWFERLFGGFFAKIDYSIKKAFGYVQSEGAYRNGDEQPSVAPTDSPPAAPASNFRLPGAFASLPGVSGTPTQAVGSLAALSDARQRGDRLSLPLG
jgi:hypothetical protein